MNKIILLAALLTIAACKPAPQTDKPPEATTTSTAPAENQTAAASTAADGRPSAGLYRVVDDTGAVLIEDLHPDGSYTFMDEARTVLEQGQWVQKSPSNLCFTANTAGAEDICYIEEVRPDGIWYSTRSGTTSTATIERLES